MFYFIFAQYYGTLHNGEYNNIYIVTLVFIRSVCILCVIWQKTNPQYIIGSSNCEASEGNI